MLKGCIIRKIALSFILVTRIVVIESFKCYKKSIPKNNHGVEPIAAFREERSPSFGNLLTNIYRYSPEWHIEFDLKLTAPVTSYWNTIFCVTHSAYGSRNPCIYIWNNVMQISATVNGDGNYIYSKNDMQIDQLYHIEISQRYVNNGQYRYAISIDGVEVDSVMNTQAKQSYNLIVGLSDNHHDPAPCLVSNFEMINFL
ncbi:uncharacterized protein [Clytia hemisphaerica]|uniref:Uncharacterized protein n=1 Tax=Clytia hemisphaerica TaxID=252671 RepID=A0A7M5X4E9_9CNID|eukprot:TCONS_00010337-protein